MSKKKKKPVKQARKLRTPPSFAAGAQVRVKPGTTDPNFSDMPLGGWAGTIQEVDEKSNPTLYLIEWNQHTLDHMHPVFRNRCDRDGLEVERMWLDEEDIVLDTGEPGPIEKPIRIITRPLNPKDEDDRVRMALALSSDDPLPEVDTDTLVAYHRYLEAHLSFPFEASWTHDSGPLSSKTLNITIIGLSDPEDEAGVDEMYGLFCHAKSAGRIIDVPLSECEARKGNANRQLLADYSYWFWNYR